MSWLGILALFGISAIVGQIIEAALDTWRNHRLKR